MTGERIHRRLIGCGLLTALALFVALPAAAHNVAVTHPEITDTAFELLRAEDMTNNGVAPVTTNPCTTGGSTGWECAYEDLWLNRGVLRPPAPRNTNTMGDSGAYLTAFNGGQASVMLGVVIEDGHNLASELRVVNHFYHAVTGVGLLDDFNSSFTRASQLFIFGLQLHDYPPASQTRSYLYCGRFLHHVEDMSSPAHIHNDAHLYIGAYESDMDDYEGRYVPGTLWVGFLLRPILNGAMTPEVVTTANKIWPVPGAPGTTPPNTSLAGLMYNRTTYFATLSFPAFFDPGPPFGELFQMFPGDPGDANDDGLHFEDPVFGFGRWVIDGVGEYHFRASWGSEDDWWPDAAADERSAGDPDGINAPYYIEQLMSGETAATALQPENLRQTWTQPWSVPGNPVVNNTVCVGGANAGAACSKPADCASAVCQGQSLVALQANNLLVPAVEYVAGAAKWWYQYANLPPYLRKVEAKQDPGMEVKYTADWVDQTDMMEYELVEAGIIPNTDENVQIVTDRALNHNPVDRKYINAINNLELRLEFNEPVRDISELKLLNTSGGEVMNVLTTVAGQGSNNTPVKGGTCRATPSTTCANDAACGGAVGSCLLDTSWTYTLEAASIDGLNGELTLMVKATDKNDHQQNGAELDETPQSPAKRNLDGPIDLRNPNIPWHNDTTNEDFAYDFANGDRNHRLLFDTEPVNVTITKTP